MKCVPIQTRNIYTYEFEIRPILYKAWYKKALSKPKYIYVYVSYYVCQV